MAAKKVVKKTVRNAAKEGATAFIAMTKDKEYSRTRAGYRKLTGEKWVLCGTDLHKSAELARACGCAENNPENVGVLEVKIIAQHQAETKFVKKDKIEIKFNDK